MVEIKAPKVNIKLDTEAMTKALEGVKEVWALMVEGFEKAGLALSDLVYWAGAYNWARRVHPKWVAIFWRTKKGRTRKKYHNRILRAYAKEVKE